MEGNVLFPVFLKIDQLDILVVGGGYVGHEKLTALLGNNPDARITVVAPVIRAEVEQMGEQYRYIKLIRRKFEFADLINRDLVICATDNRLLHEEIYREAKKQKLLINVADTPELCDFYLCSIVKKGDLKIGISTNGKSPTLAKRVKAFLNDVIPANIQESLDNLREIRKGIKGDFEEKVRRLNEHTRMLTRK